MMKGERKKEDKRKKEDIKNHTAKWTKQRPSESINAKGNRNELHENGRIRIECVKRKRKRKRKRKKR
ncbi:hypothetical protein BP00DRAFT_192299 [Aspergillus indologenus CBS 114.80]|uniref:Uncharacterized protein n=1 Tax=Aspergillus indologenus CBS 114.80 TaxID=1450541 RepID=A0A2V5I996_9EURO|nr:hypothetical protein BP00DRAFT_192299 [Aspergillus indologenus CBS 114.80]